MKKIIPCFIAALLITTCQSLQLKKKPEARIRDFDIDSISLYDITLLFDIEISNPYPVGLKLEDIGFTFFIEEKQFFKTSTAQGLKIKANGKETSVFKVNLKYTDIARIIRDYNKKDYLSCVVDTVITIPLPDIPGLQKKLTFNYKLKKQIPAIKPSIRITGFNVKMPTQKDIADALKRAGKNAAESGRIYGMFSDILSGKNARPTIDPASLDLKLKVNFDIEMKNKTRARLEFRKLDYDFLVNNARLVKGVTTDIVNKGTGSLLRVESEFSTRNLSKPVLKAFRNKKGNYNLKGEALLQLPASVKKEPLKLKFNEAGSFRL